MEILLVDDHPVFRSGMVAMMAALFPASTVEEIGSYPDLLDHIKTNESAPDLVLLDLILPGFDPTRDFSKLRRAFPITPFVIVSMIADDGLIDTLIAEGANGFVSKSLPPKKLSSALRDVMDGEIVVRRPTEPLGVNAAEITVDSLTLRQVDVLRFIARGLSNKEIARELDLSPFTVRTHVSAVLKTLGVSSRAAAASYAASNGID